MLSTNFIQNPDNLITLGNMSAENKGLECTQPIITITSKVCFQTTFFLYQLINFDKTHYIMAKGVFSSLWFTYCAY